MTWNPAPARAGTWCRQSRPESGKPCSSTTGGPSPVTSYSMPTPSTSTRANAPSFHRFAVLACHLAVVRPGGGGPVLVHCGEQGEERADLESFLGRVPELAVVPDGVPGAP